MRAAGVPGLRGRRGGGRDSRGHQCCREGASSCEAHNRSSSRRGPLDAIYPHTYPLPPSPCTPCMPPHHPAAHPPGIELADVAVREAVLVKKGQRGGVVLIPLPGEAWRAGSERPAWRQGQPQAAGWGSRVGLQCRSVLACRAEVCGAPPPRTANDVCGQLHVRDRRQQRVTHLWQQGEGVSAVSGCVGDHSSSGSKVRHAAGPESAPPFPRCAPSRTQPACILASWQRAPRRCPTGPAAGGRQGRKRSRQASAGIRWRLCGLSLRVTAGKP